jgi:hypothetical protein
MSVKYELVKAGDELYDCHRYRMGNTMCSRMGTWRVRILEIKDGGAMVSWNGNGPEFYPRRRIERLRRKPARGAE